MSGRFDHRADDPVDDPWGADEDDGDGGLDRGADVGRAPICGSCGVTMLPAEPAHVIDAGFACDNEDCEDYQPRG